MKNRLLVISDLWGKEKSDWLIYYARLLEQKFDLVFYDSCEIGGVDQSIYVQDRLHQQFVNGGIERAVDRLVQLEKLPVHVLAFSIGGSIAWKYGLKSGMVQSLNCISSTRLRNETEKPTGHIKLYFGEKEKMMLKLTYVSISSICLQVRNGKPYSQK